MAELPDALEPLLAVVTRQRACRAFAPDDLDDALVESLLMAATFAPSAENRQPWVFVVVRDGSTRAAIGDITRRAWRGGGRAFSERRLPAALLADVDRGAEGGISEAPVLVVVCGDTEAAVEATMAASIFPAVQNLLLAATAAGLGSALTTLPTLAGRQLAELIGAPDHVRPVAVVPLGRPARPLGRPRRDPMRAKTHRDRFGQPW
jgi:nitroreductase